MAIAGSYDGSFGKLIGNEPDVLILALHNYKTFIIVMNFCVVQQEVSFPASSRGHHETSVEEISY